jgi:hypothetical protein
MMNESTQLNVLISGGFTGAYEQLLPEFQRMSGIEVTTGSGASQGSGPQTIAAQFGRGVAADVVILSREGLSEMIAAKMIAAGPPPTRRRLDAASGSFGRTQAAKSCKIVPRPSKSALLAIDGTFTNDGGAIMGKSQIIHTDGEDLVVITLSDYEALRARAGDQASEDAMTVRIVAATDAKIARGEDVALPAACGLRSRAASTPFARYANTVPSRRSTSPNRPVSGKVILRTSKLARRRAPPLRSKPLRPPLECRSTSSWDDTALSSSV